MTLNKSIPAYLVVISLIRGVQIILASVLFVKIWNLSVSNQFEVFCRTNSAGMVNYEAKYPFDWLTIQAPSDCAEQSPSSTTHIWTGKPLFSSSPPRLTNLLLSLSFSSKGMGPTVYLYTALTVFMIGYSISAIIFYFWRYEDYDLQKKLPAIDLLISLTNGLLWLGDTYLAWHNLPGLKETGDPDRVISATTVCSASGAYCSPGLPGEFKDMASYLFLALANALSWGIAVWFIFMETGLAPDDYDDEVYFDLPDGPRLTGLPALVPPFSSYSMDEKAEQAGLVSQYSYNTEYGMEGNGEKMNAAGGALAAEGTVVSKGDMMQQYINAWKENAMNSELDESLFAAMLKTPTQYPQIKTVSTKELERDTIGNKVHAKWNLFKA